MTNPTPHGQVPEVLIDLIDAYAEARHRCGGIYNAKTEAARKAVIEALSGVQALSAPAGPWSLGEMTGNWRDIDLPDHGAVMRIVWKMEDDDGRNAKLEAQAHAVVAALNAASPTPPALSAAPAEWKLVPVEPTVDQEWAGKNAALRCSTMGEACKIYKAMLAASPPAEQPATTEAALGGVYAELPEPRGLGVLKYAASDMRDFADRTHALRMEQAATKAAPVVWLSSKQLRGVTALHGQYLPFRCQPEGRFDTPVYLVEAAPKAAPGELFDSEGFRAWVLQNLPDETIIGNSAWWANHLTEWAQRFAKAAPQQEAQEPCGWAVYDSLGFYELHDTEAEAKSFCDHYNKRPIDPKKPYTYRAHFTAPQPAPAPLSDDAKDAARWRWLSEHIGAAWNEGKFTSLVRIVSDKNRAALNASIDRMMAGDWSDAALAAQGDTP